MDIVWNIKELKKEMILKMKEMYYVNIIQEAVKLLCQLKIYLKALKFVLRVKKWKNKNILIVNMKDAIMELK